MALSCFGATCGVKREARTLAGEPKGATSGCFIPTSNRHPDSCPALVLNADYTPLSYYPLSLWPWQTAIKAVFLDRVDIVDML